MLILVIVLTTTVSSTASDQTVSARDLTYMTEQLPPFNFQEDGKMKGISVDLLEMVWQRMGEDLNGCVITFLPWTESYQRTLKGNNTVLFIAGRFPEREHLFKWAGPIASSRYVLLTKMEKNINITAPEDLKKIKIGAVEDDIAVQMLLDNGVKREDIIIEVTTPPIIEMLKNGSIDAWAYNDITGIWQLQESGENASDYVAAYVLGGTDGYLAFNKEVPDSLVQSFQEAIDSIKMNKDHNGISDYEKILTRYLPAKYVANIKQENRALAFLNEAVAYVNDNGIEKALREFNNRSGSFVRGDLYIFAYDFNGTNIAHPIKPELIGQKGLLDINGVDVISREIALAKRGGGAMYLVFSNPIHEDREELKLIYIENINDSLYLGSGLYLSNISAYFDKKDREELVAFVEEARQFARQSGKEVSLQVFNNPDGNFTRDGRYIFAYDYEGKALALPYQPDLIGTSRIDALDPNGVDFIRQVIDMARMGNGSTYYIYPDPSRNMSQALKLSYVVNVDDTWFLGSGIYAEDE